MKARQFIRVLVSYSRTNFFIDQGQPRGFEYELAKRYEKFVNAGRSKRAPKTHVVFIPLPFDRLIPALLSGQGDFVAAGLTITTQRQAKVAFTDPYLPHVDEVVVAHQGVQGIRVLDDLSDRTVHVVRHSSYASHLQALNEGLRQRGKPPVDIHQASENLAAEDLLELVNAGALTLTVVDRHIAHLWAGVLPHIVVLDDLKLHRRGKLGWAVRKDNPALLRSLNAFLKQHKKGTLLGNIFFKRYYQDTVWISNPAKAENRQRIQRFRHLFEKYGKQYGFDWLALTAQAYQESRLDNRKRSSRGAIGIMQILPTTARSPAVNISNLGKVENNIHAGVKYLAHLRDTYFLSQEIKPEDRVDFIFAAYNAGPTKIQRLRRQAKKQGLDPNKWFSNVEHVARRVIGQETVRYVANIYKYYIIYKQLTDKLDRKAAEIKALSK